MMAPNGGLVAPSESTSFCQWLGIEVPIIQGPIGSATTPELAAAVANAGALGMLAMTWRSPEDVEPILRRPASTRLDPSA